MKFNYRHFLVILLTLALFKTGLTQTCTTLGQNPTTAFPVCGKTIFDQKTVPLCGGRSVPTPCSDAAVYSDINPFWYKFTCFITGTLGFSINPINKNDDYDWELFDITGVDPMDIYTNKSLIISANWSGMFGTTGASSSGVHWFECASASVNGNPTFSTMPNLIAGHDYILLVSNFSSSQVGYQLSFQGGTASIINPILPILKDARAVCDGSQIIVSLNKSVRCNSLSLDGSDFIVSGTSPNTIVSATGKGCAISFDMDTLVLDMKSPLSPGSYTITSQTGTDGNTLLDNCDNQLAIGLKESLVFTASGPTPMDSMVPVICIQDTLQLLFRKPISCNSIAQDGSDFLIIGPSTVSIKAARGICAGGVSNSIQIILNKPIKTNGTYQLQLTNGSDGNSLIDECGQTTVVGATLNFKIQHVTTANINQQVKPGCKSDTLLLSHNGNNAVTQWKWTLDNGNTSNLQNPTFLFNSFGKQHTLLFVTNGYCSDTSSTEINLLDYTVKAGLSIPDTLCLQDSLQLLDKSSTNTKQWKWDFGNGVTSNLQQPIGIYYQPNAQKNSYIIRLVVTNSFNCTDTTYKKVTVLPSCYVDIPSGFTPNGDGLNDYLYPLNAFKAEKLSFKIFNRFGQVIFETNNWLNRWDGRYNGELQQSGTYVWTLDYIHKDTGKSFHLKGTTVLIR